MSCDEVLQNRQAFTVVCLNRTLNELLLRVRHQTTHTGDLLDLAPVTTSTRRHHAVDGVASIEVLTHVVSNFLSALQPQLDQFLVPGFFQDDTGVELVLNLRSLGFVTRQDFFLAV